MTGLKDMAKTHEELAGDTCVAPTMLGQDKYPYGLRITLTEGELEKLKVDKSDWEVGDTFHLDALAKVTSISEDETESGKRCSVQLQITHLQGPENEDEEYTEGEEEEPREKSRHLQYDE